MSTTKLVICSKSDRLEPPARRTRSMLSNVCLVCDSMSSANTCPLVSRAEMPESQRTSPDRTQFVNPKGSYCKTPSTATTCLVTMTSEGAPVAGSGVTGRALDLPPDESGREAAGPPHGLRALAGQDEKLARFERGFDRIDHDRRIDAALTAKCGGVARADTGDHGRVDDRRAHAGESHTAPPVLVREHLHERHHGVLRRRVRAEVRARQPPCEGGERDDVAPTTIEHPGQDRLRHAGRAEKVDGDRAVDLVDRLLGKERRQADAGCVHEPVDRPQRRLDLLHDAFDGIGVGDVAGPRAHGRSASDGGGEAVVVDVDGRYRRAGRGQAARRQLAHPAARARDQRDRRRRRHQSSSGAWNCMRTWSIELLKTARPGRPRLRSSLAIGWSPSDSNAPVGRPRTPAGCIDQAVRRSTPSACEYASTLEPRAGMVNPGRIASESTNSPSWRSSQRAIGPARSSSMSARNFGKPQMPRPASSVNSWFTGSWWMNAPRKPRTTSAAFVTADAGSIPL